MTQMIHSDLTLKKVGDVQVAFLEAVSNVCICFYKHRCTVKWMTRKGPSIEFAHNGQIDVQIILYEGDRWRNSHRLKVSELEFFESS